MAYAKFTLVDLDYLQSGVESIDESLFIFRNRGGEMIFQWYATNGMPTTSQMVFVFRRGVGFCKMLDGGTLPRGGCHFLENGWGVAAIELPWDASPAASIALVKATAQHLLWLLTKTRPSMKPIDVLRIRARYAVNRVLSKVAAFRAA